jgi:hypothetical protein
MTARHLPLLLSLVVATGAACGPNPQFVSPSSAQGPPPFYGPSGAASVQGPPPFIGPSGPAEPSPAGTGAPSGSRAPPPLGQPAPVTFYRTQDSSDWVTHNFKLQARYARVIVVSATDPPPAKVTVGKLDFEAPGSTSGATEELPVTLAVKTLDEAAGQARGGDLVAVLPGHYKGFKVGDVPDAGDGRYIHFKALGKPGDVIIDAGSAADANWMIVLEAAHHVVIQGFNLAGSNVPGGKDLHGPNAGIFISGDFLHTSKLAHHLAIVGNYSHEHKAWGIHSVESYTVLVQDNLFSLSGREHSAYFSDGSDDYVIRRNVFFGSNGSGLQVNVDPLASLEKLAKHPALDVGPMQPTREWALDALKQATARFGANAFPDGRGFNFIIESNVIYGNGRVGGAAINLAGVRESIIQNNLIYANYASGIAEWDNANPFDAAAVHPGPQSVAEMTGADVLPIFGCFNNLVRNNTVLSAIRGRPALLAGNGSWGTRAYNNVLVNDEMPSVELLNTSIWRFDGAHNVLDRVSYEGAASALKSLATSLPDSPRSTIGINRAALASNFVRPGEEPWIVTEGAWWKLNPKRPDFHPRAGSPLLAGRGDPRSTPTTDLDGKPRPKADIGAYAAAAP